MGTEGLAIGFQTLQGLEAGVVAAGDVGKAQQGDIQVGNGSGLANRLVIGPRQDQIQVRMGFHRRARLGADGEDAAAELLFA